MSSSCRRLSSVMLVRLCCRVTEGAGFDGELVEEDDGKNDPADGEEAVAGAVGGGGERQADGHVEGERWRRRAR